jgi:hypothetical protein
MRDVGLFLLVLGFVLAVPVILTNSFLWLRFTSLYVRATPEKMPFLPLDFGGRWQRSLGTPHPDSSVDRARRQLRLSQRLLLVPMAVALLGVALLVAFPA